MPLCAGKRVTPQYSTSFACPNRKYVLLPSMDETYWNKGNVAGQLGQPCGRTFPEANNV